MCDDERSMCKMMRAFNTYFGDNSNITSRLKTTCCDTEFVFIIKIGLHF